MKIQFKKIIPGAKLPTRKQGNAYYDLYTCEDMNVESGGFVTIPLGFACAIPAGHHAEIVVRSSTFKNWGMILTNQVGIIDSSYCGDNDEWCLLMYRSNWFSDVKFIPAGTRLAQFTIVKDCEDIEFEEVETLGNANRGGFGSTGK